LIHVVVHCPLTSHYPLAYNRIHSAIAIAETGDGIKVDGAFGQHDGLLYSGNYGKVCARFMSTLIVSN
jgi:hypothetical protein